MRTMWDGNHYESTTYAEESHKDSKVDKVIVGTVCGILGIFVGVIIGMAV